MDPINENQATAPFDDVSSIESVMSPRNSNPEGNMIINNMPLIDNIQQDTQQNHNLPN